MPLSPTASLSDLDPFFVVARKAAFLKSELVGLSGDYVYAEDKSVHYEIELTLRSGAKCVVVMPLEKGKEDEPKAELTRLHQEWIAYAFSSRAPRMIPPPPTESIKPLDMATIIPAAT